MKIFILILLLSTVTLASDPFWDMYERPSIAEKKAIWRGLSHDEQVDARRMNLIWGAEWLDLNAEQRDYLSRFSAKLPTLTKEETDEFQSEAVELFPTGGDLLFGSIGPYRPCSVFKMEMPTETMLQQAGYCNCSMGSSFNVNCGTCGPGVCRSTRDGCGFTWLYACAGICLPD